MGDEIISLEEFNKEGKPVGKIVALSAPPVVSALEKEEEFFRTVIEGNKYEIYDGMVKVDPELRGSIVTIAFMTQKAYDGVIIRPGETVEKKEKDLLKEAQLFAKIMRFEELFFDYADRLMRHGDVIEHIVWKNGIGITELQPLPITRMTIVENRDQIQDKLKSLKESDIQVFEANFYVMNEHDPDIRKVWKKENILHISISNRATEVRDVYDRYTFGVWSESPIAPLATMVRWKHNSIENDIVWRHRNVPREHHQLDLSAFSPQFYKGTPEEKIQSATAAAKAACQAYSDDIKGKEADQGFITDLNTKIDYIEPKSTKYTDPNELLKQMNASIVAATGVPLTALGHGEKTFAAAYEASGFALMRAEAIALKIKEKLIGLLRRHLELKFGTSEEYEKIDIRINMVLSKDRGELARQMALLIETKCFTPTEIRTMWGFEALTDEQKEEIMKWTETQGEDKPHTRTPDEIDSDFKKRDFPRDPYPEYPGEKEQQQDT